MSVKRKAARTPLKRGAVARAPSGRSAGASIVDEIASTCLMGGVRRLSRVVNGIYDDLLRPYDLKGSQLNLLVVIAKRGPVKRIDVGRTMAIDPSTLTRNLKVMLSRGWVEEVRDATDGRGDPLRITSKGLKLLTRAGPAWREAQKQARKLLGPDGASLVKDFERSDC